MAIQPRKMKSYLESQKMKKQAMMPNVLKKAGLPAEQQHIDIEIEADGDSDYHAEEAKKAHKGGIAKPMAKGSEKEIKKVMKEMASLLAEEIDEGEYDDDIMDLMVDFDPESTPEWALDEDMWKKATEIVDPEGDGAEFSDPYTVIAHLYKKMGGKIKDLDEEYEDDGEMEDDDSEMSYDEEA